MITIPELDDLTITIVVDNATDTLSSIARGVPQVPEIAYLLGRTPPTGQHDGHDCVVVFDHLCVACHGFPRPSQLHDEATAPQLCCSTSAPTATSGSQTQSG